METEKTPTIEPEVVETVPDAIQMDPLDVRIGVELEIEAARAQARAQAIADAAQIFAARMRIKYQATEEHQMTDWLRGFERVKKG